MAIYFVDLPMNNGDFPVRFLDVYQGVSAKKKAKLLELDSIYSGFTH